MGAHARKRQVSTIRGVGGSRVDVYVMSGRCSVRSSDRECVSELDMYPCCRCALTVGGVARV